MSGIGPRSAPTYNIPAPTNYVAGIGRGAMGFTTRSDIGPAKAAGSTPFADPQFGQAPAGYVAGRGRGMGELARNQGEANAPPPDQDRGDYSESNYDEFSGYSERLFAAGAYEEDDAEADQIYAEIDNFMESRRKRSREKQMLLEQQKAKNQRPRIADQFADLKMELSKVTAEEWEAIPDVGDHSLKQKQNKKKDNFVPVPDSLIASTAALRGGELGRSVDPMLDALGGGNQSVLSGMHSTVTGLAEARGSALSSKLDKMSDSVSGQTVVDPKGYLTSLNSLKITSAAEIGDIKKARILLQSVTTTNPTHGPGWIAAARVEEYANKMHQARKIILQGCEQCPESEDVWLEAARLHPLDTAKAILANAVLHIPTSVKIWLKAADLEVSESRKKAVLRRSLEVIPNSVQLWKAAIDLESVTDARIMLARAVECVPHSVEMWLALAKLESHENARKVLNEAREAIPTERATWITAAKLEEAHDNSHLVGRIIEKMVVSLSQYQVVIKRDEWIAEAIDCERSNAPITCQAIIRNTIHLQVEAEDRKTTWMDDADTCLSNEIPCVITARAILAYALEVFPSKKSLYQQAAMLEKEHGTKEALEELLKRGVQHCPQAEILWLMAAKEKWLAGNIPDARAILLEAFHANPKSEQIWLAAVKLEWENNEFIRAKVLLSRARECAPSERIWLKSALLEQEMKEYTTVLSLLEEGMKLYPTFVKFYLMAGQTSEQNLKDNVKARNYYMQGIKQCSITTNNTIIPLWLCLLRLEEKVKGILKARPTSELARMKLPANEWIWLECIRMERRAGNMKLAENLMSKALQECSKSGILWSELLLTCSKVQLKSKSIDALKNCGDQDAVLILTIARLFEKNTRFRKAKKWYERAIGLNGRLGDAWVYYFVFEYIQTYKYELIGQLRKDDKNGGEGEGEGGEVVNMDGVDEENDDEEEGEITSTTQSKQPVAAAEGLAEHLIAIIQKCKEAEPNTGELWCTIAKETEWRRKDAGIILIEIVQRVLGFPIKSLPSPSSSSAAAV